MDRRPIGIFDSGAGGLTVVKELIRCLPDEDIVYFGDTARVPYGTKSRKTIIRFSIENIHFLLKFNVKLIILACNTSSSVALTALRKSFKVPIMGVITPGAKDAVITSRNGRIGVIGTSTTVRSQAYEKQIIKNARLAKTSGNKLLSRVDVFSRSCPLFVPLVEEGWLYERVTLQIIRHYLLPLKRRNIDTLILGCTHYPLLKNGIRKVMGKRVALIDSAVSAAKAAKSFLFSRGLINNSRPKGGRLRFFVSDEPERFKRIGERFLRKKIKSVELVRYGL